MNKGALALLIHGGTENWSPQRWKGRFDEVCGDRRVLLMPDVAFDPAEVRPMGAPVLINAGRGGLQNEADILQCLEDGTLGAASLDVYATEPLPADSPFWSHPKIVLTPHNVVDPARGY